MGRAGKRKDREGPERRCVVTGESGPTDRLVRVVLGPSGEVVPDIGAKLPGRGGWITADRDVIVKAIKKRSFSRAFKQQVEAPTNLAEMIEVQLAKRIVDCISLARKAGQAVAGHEKCRARIREGTVGVLIQARDGAEDGKNKLAALAEAVGKGEIANIGVLDSAELGLAFGREFAIHAALDTGGFAARVCADAERLAGLRRPTPNGANTGEEMTRGAAATAEQRAGTTTYEGPMGGTLEQDDT